MTYGNNIKVNFAISEKDGTAMINMCFLIAKRKTN